MIQLERPAQIGPREAILMDDLALTDLSGSLAERLAPIDSEDPSLPLYVDQEQADALSELHPGLPLYGLWQTLISSGLVPEDPGLYHVVTDSSPREGRYLLREPDGAYSGHVANEIPLDAFAPDEPALKPILIRPEPERLRLPPRPIQTLRQRQTQKSRARLHTLALAGVMALGSALLGAVADQVLSHRHARKAQQAESLLQRTAQLRRELARLETGGRIEPIDQSRRLDQLLILSQHFQPVELPRISMLDAPTLSAVVRPLGLIPPATPAGLPARRITHRPDGSLRVVW